MNQAEIAAALATYSSANDFQIQSHPQRGLRSVNSSESAQALEKLSDTLWFKMPQQRRCAGTLTSADVLSQLISELRHSHFHAESQSDEFQQSQAELGQHLERANAEGAQLRNFSMWRDQNCECQYRTRSCSSTRSKSSTIHQSLHDAK